MKYWMYDFWNDHLAKISLYEINEIIKGENAVMVSISAIGIQNMIVYFFKGKNND